MLVGDKAVMGPVELTVRDLAGMLEFYQRSIGLKLLQRTGNIASLGVSDQVLLTLLEDRQARHPGRTTGLYHVAILLPSRVALARQLNHLVKTGVYLQGAADHLVSEALYLADPEGNGLELYRDRPRSQWPHEHGQLRMASDPLDIDGLLAEPQLHSEPWNGLPDGTVMGHVHLRVSDLPDAENFYRTVLGMDIMVRFGHSASFLSYGGYHHHIGINTWGSLGRPPAPTGSQGLKADVPANCGASHRDCEQ
jgi:catechol 2,3-dioxygenase